MPKIGSPEAAGILILSPDIMSPRFFSEEKFMIQVKKLYQDNLKSNDDHF